MSVFQNSVTARPRCMSRSQSHSFVQRPALVFDLDETLVWCTAIKPSFDDCFPIKIQRRRMFVQMRPGLLEFLREIKRTYDVFFFTASQPDYANQIIDQIAPSVPPSHRFFRNSCQSASGYLVKDLRILNLPLSQTILIDDTAGSALAAPRNFIRISAWSGDRADNILMNRLLPFLESIACENDLVGSIHDILAKTSPPGISPFPWESTD
jgi:Dullard-like phosphatase family protein